MKHELKALSFWPYHLLMACTVAMVMSGIQYSLMIGSGNEAFMPVFQNTVATTFIDWTIFATSVHLFSKALGDKVNFLPRYLLACVVAVPVITELLPIINWFFGTMLPNLNVGSNKEDILAITHDKYFRRMAVIMVTAMPIWMLVNYQWYSHQEARKRMRAAATAPQPAPIPTQEYDAAPSPSTEGEAPQPTEHGPAPAPRIPSIVARLSPEKHGELWAITSEQHYLRIYTEHGDDLILMRFSDALETLEAHDGIQIHRSHWVARAGIDKTDKDTGGKLFIVLKNGIKFPVSRPNQSLVKQYLGLK
ncbi:MULTISPECIES: LytTR family DNA-binding domain-containing protein [Kordiimonas]|uniref:LytTR family DNA-binding domain-containing protein n=1 Tax=Kordiimonas TaxID=288021 RepID=UPI00257E753C|nr:LytTR family DNA-binding domain-containing protein [Kordiimonas sp. UBA4487]